jgi:serine/threonine-protein kinase
MIDGRGRARIMDFGIAAIGEVRGASAIAGTPVYMAPEQLAGREATTKSDLYSLGLVLHEVFTGKRVHDVETMADLRELHQTASRPTSLSRWVSDLDPAIERAVMRCLESDPADRPPSAIAVAASLPGGDPLAAALAAGETPSPELVAAAGSRGGLRPPVALALVGVVIAMGVAMAWIARRTDMIAAVNPPMPRVVLEQKAREILAEFEGEQEHEAEASGWMLTSSVATWLLGRDATPERWTGLEEMWGGPVQFWFRASDTDLLGGSSMYDTEIDDPPRIGTGHRMVRLDAHGRLLWLEISTAEANRPVAPVAGTVDEAKIDRVFTLAGLDRGAFRATETRALTRIEHDVALAWVGPYPGMEGEEVRANLALRDGTVCWFRVEYPFDVAETGADAAAAAEMPEWAEWMVTGITWMLVAGGGVIAWKNIRARRSDVRAGVRAALAILIVAGVGAVMMRDRVPEVGRVFFGENPIVTNAVLNAGYFLLFYIALEPTARRVWPSLLVSWIRLTSGRWRDPMVGRDVLIGIAAGALMMVAARVGNFAPAWFGAGPGQPIWTSPAALMGTHHVAAYTLFGMAVGTIQAAVLTLMLVVLRVVVRSKLAAVIVLSVIWVGLAAASMLTTHWSSAVIIGAVQAIQIAVLLRFGFLAMASATAVTFIGAIVPAGFESASWWAGAVAVPALALAGLVAYGYFTAVGDRGPTGGTGRRVMP